MIYLLPTVHGVLHVSPEAALGGPLALVQDGDLIKLDVESRRLDLLVPESELDVRRKKWKPPEAKARRGYAKLYTQHVIQAHEGGEFDFLHGTPGDTPEPDIF
jgi:dihydroxy-acid dehydratase